MSYYCDDSAEGYIQLNPDLNDSYDGETGEEIYIPSHYPFRIPRVYLEGSMEVNADLYIQSTIVVDGNVLTKYTPLDYMEELVEDENGNIIWIDCRDTYKEDWKGKHLRKFRYADEFRVEDFDLNTLEKKVYRTKLESSSRMDLWDYYRLVDYIDPNLIKKINDHKDDIPSPSN